MAGGGLVGSGQAPQPQQQASAGFGSMGPMMTSHQTGPMIRQQLRGAMAARPQATGMYPGGPTMQNTMGPRHPIQGQPGQMYNPGAGGPGGGQPVNTAPSAMAQYGGYQQNPMMGGASTGGMMGPGGYQQTSYQSSMMGLRQPGYLSQGQMVQRPPQYMQTTAGGGGLGMMSGGQAYARPTMGGMAGAAGSATSLGPTAGMGAGGGAGGSMVSGGSMVAGGGGAGDGMMHHRMMMAPTTTTNTGQQQQQQSQMMSHLQRSMSGPQQQHQGNAVQQQQTQQPGQQAQTGVPQAGQQPNPQAQRQTMMGQGRGYPQPPY